MTVKCSGYKQYHGITSWYHKLGKTPDRIQWLKIQNASPQRKTRHYRQEFLIKSQKGKLLPDLRIHT